jgi:hypothetical protein
MNRPFMSLLSGLKSLYFGHYKLKLYLSFPPRLPSTFRLRVLPFLGPVKFVTNNYFFQDLVNFLI